MSKNDIYVTGIHILFALVIGSIFASFSEDLFPITVMEFSFKSVLIFITLATIILSWVGYNKRIEEYGHESGTLFVIDIVIIYFYFQMVYSINESFKIFALSMALLFVAYSVWYYLKYRQDHKKRNIKKFQFQIIALIGSTAIFFILFGAIETELISNVVFNVQDNEIDQTSNERNLVWVLILMAVLLIPFRLPDLKPGITNLPNISFDDHKYMEKAIEEAEQGLSENGIPIGSILVEDKKILGKGHNKREQDDNPLAHGEIMCLINAGREVNYKNATLYSTLMPCYLCAGAIVQFGIKKVVVGESKTFSGAEEFMKSHEVEIINLNLNKCIEMMTSFIEKNPKLWNEDIGLTE